MAYIYALSDTWNAAGTTFTGIGLNVTDTASAAGSLLLNLQVGGTSLFNVDKTGALTLPAGASNSAPSLKIGTNVGLFSRVSGSLNFGGIGNFTIEMASGEGLRMGPNQIGWGASVGGNDLIILRDAANTLAQRNGTNAQTFRVYNTFTDASNYERGFFRYVSNVLEIGHEAAGTGNAGRDIRFITQGFTAMTLSGASLSMGVAVVFTNGTRMSNTAFCAANNVPYGWSSTTNVLLSPDTTLVRTAAAIVGVRGTATTDGAAISLIEQTAPAAPATNGVYIYAEDNGSGKTRLMARFATGAAVQIAIEP
jgi:hypothetical protein